MKRLLIKWRDLRFSWEAFWVKYKKKIYKFSCSRGILHISAKLEGGICKTSCSLTEKFNGGGKLINVVQFQGGNWSFVNVRGWIDETYNFKGVIAYLLIKLMMILLLKTNDHLWNKNMTTYFKKKLPNTVAESLFPSSICNKYRFKERWFSPQNSFTVAELAKKEG